MLYRHGILSLILLSGCINLMSCGEESNQSPEELYTITVTPEKLEFVNTSSPTGEIKLTLKDLQGNPVPNGKIKYLDAFDCGFYDDDDIKLSLKDGNEIKREGEFQVDDKGEATLIVNIDADLYSSTCRLDFYYYDSSKNGDGEGHLNLNAHYDSFEATLKIIDNTANETPIEDIHNGGGRTTFCEYTDPDNYLDVEEREFVLSTTMIKKDYDTYAHSEINPPVDVTTEGDCSHIKFEGPLSEDGHQLILNNENKAAFKLKMLDRVEFQCTYTFSYEFMNTYRQTNEFSNFQISVKSYSIKSSEAGLCK